MCVVWLKLFGSNKIYLIIDQQIAWHFMPYSECLLTPFPTRVLIKFTIFLIQWSQPIMIKWRDFSQWWNPYSPLWSSSVASLLFYNLFETIGAPVSCGCCEFKYFYSIFQIEWIIEYSLNSKKSVLESLLISYIQGVVNYNTCKLCLV